MTTDGLTIPGDPGLPDSENELSRRYLNILQNWIPVGVRSFERWPDRPECGHFFGGVHWYGLETALPAVTLAAAASSPEYDASVTGVSADELRRMCVQGLRYLCFTHDTGPEDCVRPSRGLGAAVNCATKWGERGAGFFPESQCGGAIAAMLTAAALLREQMDDETWAMLGRVVEDYMRRFQDLPPRSGVYNDTQTEENSWTARGLLCGPLLLAGHPRATAWEEHAKRWMFCVATRPEDSLDYRELADGRTVRDLCRKTYTTLPDGLAENHGFVHPSYLGSGVAGTGLIAILYRLFRRSPPAHLFHGRRATYGAYKLLCDGLGAPHAVQGMDWPYSPHAAAVHAVAAALLDDPEAALLERRSLEVSERALAALGGRYVREDVARFCHGPQDPAIMKELHIQSFTLPYLLHRMASAGPAPVEEEAFERKLRGVHVFPHGGALLHRHAKGQTSMSWRNRTMVLPYTREGMAFVCPATGSLLAWLRVKDRPDSVHNVCIRVHDGPDRVVAALVQDLAQDSVRRQILFAGLPDGDTLLFERLVARLDVEVERLEHGFLRILNDGKDPRRLFHPDGEAAFRGFVSDNPDDDVVLTLDHPAWVNVDDRLGLVFEATGQHGRLGVQPLGEATVLVGLTATQERGDVPALRIGPR